MQINLSAPLFDKHGERMKEGDGTLLSLYHIAAVALTDVPADGDSAAAVYRLWLKVEQHKDGAVELKSEDVTLLKRRIEKMHGLPVIVIGQAICLLDPAEAGDAPRRTFSETELKPNG